MARIGTTPPAGSANPSTGGEAIGGEAIGDPSEPADVGPVDSTPAPVDSTPAPVDGAQPPVRARGSAVLTLALVALLVLAADAVVKYFVVARLTDHPPVRTLGGLVYLNLIRNSGAAFSVLANQTWVFTVVATAAVVWIGVLAARLRSIPWALALGLVAGGALGNLADRVFRAPGFLVGHVVDYISLFGPYGEHFAIFNLADSMLCVGIGLAVLLELTGRRRDGTRARRRSDAAA